MRFGMDFLLSRGHSRSDLLLCILTDRNTLFRATAINFRTSPAATGTDRQRRQFARAGTTRERTFLDQLMIKFFA
jgi:hypothetical protein